MAKFIPGQEIVTNTPTIEVTNDAIKPLTPGRHRFRLVVEDDSGNKSEPSDVEVIVVDKAKPTAVLDAPTTVAYGTSFTLSGTRSFDLPPGKITTYHWVQIS